MRKPRALAGELIKAGDKAQRAAKRVLVAEQALKSARNAQTKADAKYLELVRQTIQQAPVGLEGAASHV